MNNEPAPENEAELEAFRRRWREEVQSRNKNPQTQASPERVKPQQRRKSTVQPTKPAVHASSSSTKKADEVDYDHFVPEPYHDLPNKDDALKLGVDGQGQEQQRAKALNEPKSALEHYEKAVEKEGHGQLGDSLNHYRKAFKLDDGVHEDYKKKHFPPSAFAKPKAPPTAANSSKAVGAAQSTATENTTPSLPATLKQLVDDFSLLSIEPAPPETDYSPQKPCHLAEIPEEILSHILLELAIIDVASFARMAQVCKRLAYLVLTEESIWKAVTLSEEYGFPAMHYNYATTIEGRPLEDDYSDLRPYHKDDSDSPSNTNLSLQTIKSLSYTQSLLPNPYPSWRQMFRTRPRLRFNGCYISTVNYARPGAHASNSLAWGAPVLVVTYFRYLRFFRDGTAISLLSTTEPADVVHHLTKANLDLYDSSRKTRGHHHHNQGSTATSALPGAVMKEALRGRWRLSGPLYNNSSSSNPKTSSSPTPTPGNLGPPDPSEPPSEDIEEIEEEEGTVHIETQGVVPRYTYKLALALGHAGKSARNNKLAWKGFWSHNRLSDDWGEFSLRNDRAFYWSRVRSYDGWE